MRGWLVYDRQDAERNRDYINRYLASAQKRKIALTLIYTERLSFGIRNNRSFFAYEGAELSLPDFAVVRSIFPVLSRQLEAAGIAVFNSSALSELCNDKQKTYQLALENNIPVLDTVFATKTEADALSLSYPLVLKPARGRGGAHVSLVKNREEFLRAKQEIPRDDVILQQVASRPGKDLRVYVLGETIVAAMLRTAREGIRSNFCLGGEASVYTLSSREEQLVNTMISLLKPGLAGIDFLFHEEGLVFNEAEDVVGARMLYAHTNIDIADEYLSFIRESVKTRRNS